MLRHKNSQQLLTMCIQGSAICNCTYIAKELAQIERLLIIHEEKNAEDRVHLGIKLEHLTVVYNIC